MLTIHEYFLIFWKYTIQNYEYELRHTGKIRKFQEHG